MSEPDYLEMRVEGPSFVAGLDVKRGVVIRAAPIVRYMLGWTLHRVQEYAYRRGWKVS